MKRAWILIALVVLAVAVLAAAPLVGIIPIPVSVLWDPDADPMAADVLWKLRLPRVAMAFLAGAGLAASGMAFQAMFRNPLATPFTLGVASGASLGSAVSIRLGLAFALVGIPAVTLCSFAGAVLTIALVYGLTRTRRGFSTATMLLAGVAVSFFFSSVILFIQYLSDFTQTHQMLRWVMGGLDRVVTFDNVLTTLPLVAAGALIVLYLSHELNLLLTGEPIAASRGVEVDRTKKILFFAASLMVGAVVSVCGPIGFVGLMVPHIGRLLIGADHRFLAPAVCLLGGTFLTLCDVVGRCALVWCDQLTGTALSPGELPVGIITALLGGPFFLWLLLGRSDLDGLP
ncbi:MAG: iron ABC transporter permease [Pirellulales bacterium]|nr:iron ABC transporter permease [Pirellulales bacterium]